MHVQQLQAALASKQSSPVRVLRHADACVKVGVSKGKLFDMIAKGQFPKPFPLVPGGRSVGFLESDIDAWILSRKEAAR